MITKGAIRLKMKNIVIDGKNYDVPEGITIIQACELAGIEIPRFCYHERLNIAGNCRMCLVEVAGGPPKPVASCAMPIAEGMQISTDTPMVKKAREGAMEFLLANHPLDCPICDQGGECDLQDQAYQYGKAKSRYNETKRAVENKNMGPLINTIMTRCIHCTRCIRFIEDVAGTSEIGAVGRGEKMEITTYLEENIKSELSGNVIDLCPVGALTSKPYAFKARSWELRRVETIDIMDALGSNISMNVRGTEVMRILPRLNEDINEEWISDKARFCYDGLKYQRLDKSYLKKDGKLTAVKNSEVIQQIASKIKSIKSEEIAIFSGPLSSVEDIFALKSFANKLGVASTECRLKDEKIDSSDRASYLFNSKISGIDKADLCLLVGVNPRKDAPVLNARIRKRFLSKKLTIASIGCSQDLTYPYTDLGNDIEALHSILEGSHSFCKLIKEAQSPMIIFGADAISGPESLSTMILLKKIAEKFGFVKDGWSGFNFLAKSTGLINGLELDFTSNGGISSILNKICEGAIKMVILHEVDDIDLAILKNSFVLYIGSHGDKAAHLSDAILPSCAYSEKDATYINLEGRAQRSKIAISPLGEALEGWKIVLQLAVAVGIDIGFDDNASLRSLLQNFYNFLQKNEEVNAEWISAANLSLSDQRTVIVAKDFDYYTTNQIARASKILRKCSQELK